ncbi:MAG: chemotaxis response regulator protein-glutamate methylesterase [Syntrophaceae bacterium]|nr:chemotaxis response regulator protein-glutamate methylesterase [Syntrophaceae bacterium]
MIRVLVVDDSPLMCKILTNIINCDPQILVAAVATNGKEAVDLVPRLKPDIITMDIDMPVMDGFEATKQIMAYHPTPILIVSSTVFKAGMEKVFKAISQGALDVIDKSDLEVMGDRKSGEALIAKIKFLTGVRVTHRPSAKLRQERPVPDLKVPKEKISDRIVALVASTGGPQALLEILKRLPEDFPCGIVIVQHITNGFLPGLVDWLGKECKIKVKIGEDSEEIRPGVAYIAPDNLQMRVADGGRITLSDEPPCGGHRPSGDVLLESVARTYGKGSVAAILTGMGRDGAMGMKAIKQCDGRTLAQNEKSCVVFGMPSAAIEMNVVDKVLPVERMAEEILQMVRQT